MSQVNKLKDRIFKKKSHETGLTSILGLIRDLGCFGDIVGRDFEVLNTDRELVYTIRQKPMAIKQINTLLEELHILKSIDNEREAAKWGKK